VQKLLFYILVGLNFDGRHTQQKRSKTRLERVSGVAGYPDTLNLGRKFGVLAQTSTKFCANVQKKRGVIFRSRLRLRNLHGSASNNSAVICRILLRAIDAQVMNFSSHGAGSRFNPRFHRKASIAPTARASAALRLFRYRPGPSSPISAKSTKSCVKQSGVLCQRASDFRLLVTAHYFVLAVRTDISFWQ
jgi:hypothetical protein